MDDALNNLVRACHQSIADLEAIFLNENNLSFSRFDHRGWKNRLDQISKAMEAAGLALCDWSRAQADLAPRDVDRLCGEIERLVRHVNKYPTSRGRAYLKCICESSIAAIGALEKIATLLPSTGITLIEAYQWNQTKRIREVPLTPHEHLILVWERWNSQISDAAEEIKRIADNEEPEDDALLDSEDDEVWMIELLRKMTPSEIAMSKECYSIVKLTRSLMRKVRVKCINIIDGESIKDTYLIDEFYNLGAKIIEEADNLATSVFPVQDSFLIRGTAIDLSKLAQNLAEIAASFVTDNSTLNWFDNCIKQLDKLIVPVIERSPLR